jgi:4-hydroxybenzoate polyprenyltransferase
MAHDLSAPAAAPPSPASPSPASLGVLRRLGALAGDIKLSHTVFALPFALLATFLAARSRGAGHHPDALSLGLILGCMVSARSFAMAINRWADARYDGMNPRTAQRAIPSGRLSSRFVLASAIACAAMFLGVASGFWWLRDNPWPALLAPTVLAWLAGYSYSKRFTRWCHLYLGVALAISPVAAVIAIRPAYLAQPDVWLLAGMVTCWVAGFDILYALQDVEVDRQLSLHSLPSRLGVEPALWISRGLHALSAGCLVALARVSEALGPFFACGVGAACALLVLEHALVWRSRTRHLNLAFFTVNGVISLLLGGLGVTDALTR